jgi:hypothetical protein
VASEPQPLSLLQIVREPLRPGSEAAFHAIEEERARISAALGCPHPYLGAESLTGSKEAWWFNGYETPAEKEQIYDAYAKNTPLLEAFQQSAEPKANLTFEPIEVFASYRPDWSVGAPWRLGHGRFLVITVTRSNRRITGTVFEDPDGTRYIVTSAQTRLEADAARALAGPESNILAVRPSWSFPAREWVSADSQFWEPNSRARRV